MKKSGIDIISHKERGEWAELVFMAKATEHGFKINKPWGDSFRYDVAIDLDGRLVRIQVKSTLHQRRRPNYNFVVTLRRNFGRRYQQSDFDFLALYVIPKDVWYIIPSGVAAERIAILVSPGNRHNRYHQYRDAWHLLCGKDGSASKTKGRSGITLRAMAEDYPSAENCSPLSISSPRMD